jgi:hypothetical protein
LQVIFAANSLSGPFILLVLLYAKSYGIFFLCARSSGMMDNKFTLSFLFTTTHPRLCRAGQ